MVYIFVLLLENNKYYINTTNNKSFKLTDLNNMPKPDWIVIHKPKQVIEIIPNCTEADSLKYTLKYMKKYGLQNVRGGPYSNSFLDTESKTKIQKLIETKNL